MSEELFEEISDTELLDILRDPNVTLVVDADNLYCDISDDPDISATWRPHWLVAGLFGAILWIVAGWCVWKFELWRVLWRAI